MPASNWIRPLVIAAVIAFLAGGLGLALDQPRLAPVGLFIGELLTILAAIAWATPKLPLFSETRPINTAAGDTTNGVAATPLVDEPATTQSTADTAPQDDAL